jgi:hypothetical protein
MKITTTALLLLSLVVFTRCGTEGVGVNVGKVVPVKFPVALEGINDPRLPILGLTNPPAYELNESFQLSDITSQGGDAIESIVVNALQYKIEGVDSNENFQMENFSVTITRAGGAQIAQFDLFTGGTITNQPKTSITNYDSNALVEAMKAEEEINIKTVIDFAEIPSPIDFDFTFYFDVFVKVRP